MSCRAQTRARFGMRACVEAIALAIECKLEAVTDMDEIKAEVRRFISENFIMGAGGRVLADGDSFLDHHVLDSTGFLELISYLEATFGIKVLDEEMVPENLDSLDSVTSFVLRKKSG